ncbi:hypothetical protein J3R83DRAFT_11529 [Lanmaoa asiatica]|nr:hypothetical protein J3R83DRAFT_11529 [Lanmaoa asiatica]
MYIGFESQRRPGATVLCTIGTVRSHTFDFRRPRCGNPWVHLTLNTPEESDNVTDSLHYGHLAKTVERQGSEARRIEGRWLRKYEGAR